MERYRTTLILLGVLIALGALALLLNRGDTDTSAVPTPVPEKYVWQDTNPVIAIDVVSATGRVSVRQEVASTAWHLAEPISDVAEAVVVNSMAGQLQNLIAMEVLTDVEDLSQYDLDDTAFMITATFSDTQQTKRTLEVGGLTIDAGGYYVRQSGGDTVYVVSNVTIEPLRSWLESPPKAPPTPTPLPLVTPTEPITGTTTITGTATVTGTLPITSTSPGSANPTTPDAGTPVASPTATR